MLEVPTILVLLVLIAVYAAGFAVFWKFVAEPLIWRMVRRGMWRSYVRHGIPERLAKRQADESMRENWDVAW